MFRMLVFSLTMSDWNVYDKASKEFVGLKFLA